MIDPLARPSLWDRMVIARHQAEMCRESGDLDGEWRWSERAESLLEELCTVK